MTCPDCHGTGYIEVDRPVYGNPSEVEQVEERCQCNPEPTDVEMPDWEQGTAYEEFRPRFNDARYAGI